MAHKFCILLSCCCLTLHTTFAWSQEGGVFHPGESVTYDIKKFKLKAGEAVLTYRGPVKLDNQDLILIVFKATALNFLDEEKIYLYPDTFRPYLVERNLNIFGKKEFIREEYYHASGKVKIVKQAGDKTEIQELSKDQPMDNLYGFIYRFRQKGNFSIGNRLEMNLPTKDVTIFVKEKKKIKAADGETYDAYYLTSDPSQYNIWFDSHPREIPLRIDGAVGFGNTALIMRSYHSGR